MRSSAQHRTSQPRQRKSDGSTRKILALHRQVKGPETSPKARLTTTNHSVPVPRVDGPFPNRPFKLLPKLEIQAWPKTGFCMQVRGCGMMSEHEPQTGKARSISSALGSYAVRYRGTAVLTLFSMLDLDGLLQSLIDLNRFISSHYRASFHVSSTSSPQIYIPRDRVAGSFARVADPQQAGYATFGRT